MKRVNPPEKVDRLHEMQIRVRYQETDGQGHVHHANYVTFFEVGRTEMLRSSGFSYRDFENSGLMLVVVEFSCQYFQPAYYDDLLTLQTAVIHARGVRIRHQYEMKRGDALIVRGFTTVACVDRDGQVKRLPAWLRNL